MTNDPGHVTGAQHHGHLHHQPLRVGPSLLLLQPPAGRLQVPHPPLDLGAAALPALPPPQVGGDFRSLLIQHTFKPKQSTKVIVKFSYQVRAARGVHLQHPGHHHQQIRDDRPPVHLQQVTRQQAGHVTRDYTGCPQAVQQEVAPATRGRHVDLWLRLPRADIPVRWSRLINLHRYFTDSKHNK